MSRRYRGLTWDHPRGTLALRAASAGAPGVPPCDIEWDAQPLEGFESTSIGDHADRYDLVVLDHPHLGEAISHGSLRPIDEIVGPQSIARIRRATIGNSAASYELDGRLWALPLDAAAQVSVRSDSGIPSPSSWREAAELASACRTALPTTGPHLFLTLCAIALGDGVEPGAGQSFLPLESVAAGLALLEVFVPRSAERPDIDNPIAVLESMSAPEGPQYCPHLFGYVNYAVADRARPLLFDDAPRGSQGRIGSVLGGTGIAATARCEPSPELTQHLEWLLSVEAQRAFIPANGGQPSAIAAWTESEIDSAANGFYSRTRATLESAWVRPRHDGAVPFQIAASNAVRKAVIEHGDAARLARELDDAFQQSLELHMRVAATGAEN